jgi:hypothetical protein
MENLSTFQIAAMIVLFAFLPVLLIVAMISSSSYKNKNVATLIAQTGWKHTLIEKGTVERRFSSTTDGIDWTLEFRISRSDSQHSPAQLMYPKILEWHTSSVKLPEGAVYVITIPVMERDVMEREFMELAYQVMLAEVDVWLSEDLSPYQTGSFNFQSRYTVMATSEDDARQVVAAAEKPLLDWPETHPSRLINAPTPTLWVDSNGITIRINLQALGVKTRDHKTENPFIERVHAIVRLGVETATRLRN